MHGPEGPGLAAALGAIWPAGVRTLDPTDGGSTLRVWRVQDGDGRCLAVRVGTLGDGPALAREGAMLQAAQRAGVPCPAVVARIDAGGLSTLWTTWQPGDRVLETVLQHPDRLVPLAQAAGRVQAALHRAAPGPELAGAGMPWAAPRTADEAAASRRCPDDGPPRLLHLDFHPLNLLAGPDGVAAVLDWANAGVGDPRRDVARTAAILLLEAPPEAPWHGLFRQFAGAWWAAYEARAGPLRDMPT